MSIGHIKGTTNEATQKARPAAMRLNLGAPTPNAAKTNKIKAVNKKINVMVKPLC